MNCIWPDPVTCATHTVPGSPLCRDHVLIEHEGDDLVQHCPVGRVVDGVLVQHCPVGRVVDGVPGAQLCVLSPGHDGLCEYGDRCTGTTNGVRCSLPGPLCALHEQHRDVVVEYDLRCVICGRVHDRAVSCRFVVERGELALQGAIAGALVGIVFGISAWASNDHGWLRFVVGLSLVVGIVLLAVVSHREARR